MSVKIVELIETQLTRRGAGTTEDPLRIVTQFWTKTGEFVCEIDPSAEVVTPLDMRTIKHQIRRQLCADVENLLNKNETPPKVTGQKLEYFKSGARYVIRLINQAMANSND